MQARVPGCQERRCGGIGQTTLNIADKRSPGVTAGNDAGAQNEGRGRREQGAFFLEKQTTARTWERLTVATAHGSAALNHMGQCSQESNTSQLKARIWARQVKVSKGKIQAGCLVGLMTAAFTLHCTLAKRTVPGRATLSDAPTFSSSFVCFTVSGWLQARELMKIGNAANKTSVTAMEECE